MDSHNRLEQSESSEDEDNFSRYMDENGVIGNEEEGILELDGQDVLELDEDEEQRMLGLREEEIAELGEDGLPYTESPSEGNRSGMQGWKEQFSFSHMAEGRSHTLMEDENRMNEDFITSQDADDHSSAEHLSKSITLSSALDRHPPSRDQQLDMTEDDVDQRSSLGAWDGEEDENCNEEPFDFLYDESSGHGRFEQYDQTSAGEEQWDIHSGEPEEDCSKTSGNQEEELVSESISPSSPPVPTTWSTRLLNRFGRLSLTPKIEDETLPESSVVDSGDVPPRILAGNLKNVAPYQAKIVSRKANNSPSTPSRSQKTKHSSNKKSKPSMNTLYGRGQLNYPLPDFSKVGPRVRFPRDEQGYRPPQPRKLENQNQGVPVIFKSPAEIVREVLLNSTELATQDPVQPPMVPQEFKTPQQATVLVHQLQEDYHKLLTKYAEAENTIDRLRLEAKVHLYSDPPKPSHSVQMGTVMQGSKIMEFTIPQPQTATLSSMSDHQGVTEGDSGSSLVPKPIATSPDVTLQSASGQPSLHPPEDISSTLKSHVETLHREVNLFEELLHGGNLSPEEQRQAVQELRGSLDVLEHRFLKARDQRRQEQRRSGARHQVSELDPQRELEGAIFQLGVQLDELQEKVENVSSPLVTASNNSPEPTITTHHLGNAPVPSAVVPIPALQTPYPQVSSPDPPGLSVADVGTLNKEDPAEYLPQPVRHKHIQLETDYGTLLSTYSSFKSLPDALGIDQDEWPQQQSQNARPHDHPQAVTSQGHFPTSRSEDHTQVTATEDPLTPIKSQLLQDPLMIVSPRERPTTHKPTKPMKQKLLIANKQSREKNAIPRTVQQAERSLDNMHTSRPTNETSAHHASKARPRTSSVSSEQHRGPSEGQLSAVRRMSQSSRTYPHVSLSSPLSQLREQSSRSPTTMLSVSQESVRGPPSRKSSISNKSLSPAAQKEPTRTRGGVLQRRMLSPETDSGFLGSESGRSLLLQKQRAQLNLSREDPAETPNSCADSNIKRERTPSKTESGQLPWARKALWDRRKENGRWPGPSEGSSPSPGQKSLTESESRDQSQTDRSDSEPEAYNDVTGNPSSNPSLLPSPADELPQPHGSIADSRTARDEAIYNLQKEVVQLRQHLESSLRYSPTRGQPGQSASTQNPHNVKIRCSSSGVGSPVCKRGSTLKASREGPPWSSSVSHDRSPSNQAAQGGRAVLGENTGTPYDRPGSPSFQSTRKVTVPHCHRCQETERKTREKTSLKNDGVPDFHPACPLCRVNNESNDAQRAGMSNGENTRSNRRHPHFKHWFMGHLAPPMSYVHPPLVSYSQPVIYGTSPGFYVPVGYNLADVRRQPIATSPPALQLDDLRWPLSRVLEAAKELQVTSRRMCRSLTMDVSMQRNLRASCLF